MSRVYEADRALVARMRAGEQPAFDEFFNANAPRLVAFLARRSRMDPSSLEDVVQCALIKAVRNLASYRGEAALLTWLTEICRHELADVHRKAARRPAHVSLDATGVNAVLELRIPEHQEPVSELQVASQQAHIMRVLDGLPQRYARALEGKYGDGMSVEEMAREFGLTTIAVQSLLARAREAFRERWQESASEEVRLGFPS
jgi:RNA polymerase sigma-70 factor, ECF subfamily